MLKLIGDGNFPFDNISYLLFEDVINWFTCDDIQGMTYSKDVRLFWATGQKLMKNKFLEFMRGPSFKDAGRVDLRQPLKPESTEINFAVPARQNLVGKDTEGVSANLLPGFLTEMQDAYIANNPDALKVEHNVSGDLKTSESIKT